LGHLLFTDFKKDNHEATSKRRGAPQGSELEENIALFRQQIVKEWGNNNDNSVVYHHPSGVDIACTPLMIRDWAIAIVSLCEFCTHSNIVLISLKA